MTKQVFWKQLFMILIGIIVTIQIPINWAFLTITLLAAILPYLGKNVFLVFLTSTSQPDQVSWQNVVSGILIAVGAGLTEYFGQIVAGFTINWPMLWHVVIGVTLTYITATFFSPPNSTSPKMFKK
jgi:hypothetical protein